MRQKVPKNRAVVYGIRCFLCSQIASAQLLQYSSVGSHLATRCLSQCLGRQELATLKHHAACFQALLGCSLCLPTLPFRFQRRITFAMKIYWNVSRTLTRTIVISKKHRQCQNHNGNPCCLEAIVRGTSKRSTAIIFFKNCRMQCDPQHSPNSRKD